MNIILIVIQIIASVALIGLILMQQGKGADAGASFGAGASQTFFGSAGSANAMTKMTALFAAIFFAASLGLAYVAQEDDKSGLQKELSEQLEGAATPGDAANSGLTPKSDDVNTPENSDLAPSTSTQNTAPAVPNETAPEVPAAITDSQKVEKIDSTSTKTENLPVPKTSDQK